VCALLLAAGDGAAQKTTVYLQLKWDHEFQFAGYYAALWQGFYDEAGLDVVIRSRMRDDGSLVNVIDEVVSGRAEFGVGSTDILLARGAGVPLIVVTSIFQESPYAIVSLPETGIRRPSDLAGKRVSHEASGIHRVELDTLLVNEGIDPGTVTRVPFRPSLDMLTSGECDATMSYDLSASWMAKERGIEISLMRPSEFNVLFYGDTLFTHRRMTTRSPDLVERFRTATLRGWSYAMEHPDEIATRISTELPRIVPLDDPIGYNAAEIQAVRRWMRFPAVAIGTTNPWRWNGIYGQMRDAGLVPAETSLEDLVFNHERLTRSARSRQTRTAFGVLSAGALALLILFLFSRVRSWALPALACVLLLLGLYMLDRYQQSLQMERLRLRVTEQAGAMRVQLEGAIQTTEHLLTGMSRLIGAHGHLSDEEFASLASGMLEGSAAIRSFAAAPDFVVKHVYPFEENKAVLGLDYRTDPEQSDAAMRAVEVGGLVVAGPLALRQGGRGLVARVPVYDTTRAAEDGSPAVWGLIAAAIDLDILLHGAGLTEFNQDFDIALRGTDGLGEYGEVFFGHAELFEDAPVLQNISLASGTWQLAMAPLNGWESMRDFNYPLWLTGLVFTALVIMMIIYRQREQRVSAKNAAALRESEARLSRAQSLAKVYTARAIFKERVFYIDSTLNQLMGYPCSDNRLSFKRCGHMLTTVGVDRAGAMYRELKAGAPSVEGLFTLKRADNRKIIHLHLIGEVLPSAPGELFVTTQDVTTRVEAERALRDSEERFSLAMKGTNDGIWDYDIDRKRVYVSPGWLRMLGFAEDRADDFAVPGAAMRQLHPEDFQRVNEELDRALLGGSDVYEIEARVLHASGRTLHVLSRGHVVRNADGRALRLVGVNTDLTALKQAEREKQHLETQLLQAQKMEALGLLTGGIAHDFNNVLASVIGFTDLSVTALQHPPTDPERVRGYLAEVTRASERARDLVRQLLSFSRPDSGEIRPVRPAPVVDELLPMLRASVPTTIALEAPEIDTEAWVLADPVQVHQMLMNLVINARDAVGERGEVFVSVRREEVEGWQCASCRETFSGLYVVISVRDNGPGFAPEALDRVFEPFFTTKPSGKGSGMGLAVVHGIVHGARGHVCLNSEPGAGSVIRLALPAVSPPAPAESNESPEPASQTRVEVEVLVVDDEAAVADFVSEALGTGGFRSTCCSNGAEARDLFDREPDRFGLVITDQTMPLLTGSALAAHIRAARPDLPIILMSGYSENLDAERAAGSGVTLYLSKPVSLRQLLSAVRDMLGAGSPASKPAPQAHKE
jgi:PAS domain S-box-containing protein